MTTAFFARSDFRAQLVQELARHHRTMREENDLTECKCGAWYRNINEHLADVLAPLMLTAEPPQPSPEHQAIYLDDYDQVWCDYPTVPSDDQVLPLVWASEQAQSRSDLADGGNRLRVIGWCR